MIRTRMSASFVVAVIAGVLATVVPAGPAVAAAPTAPSPRGYLRMAYDAASNEVVLFGGYNGSVYFGDTWTWDGTDWSVPFRAWIKLNPTSGPPGTVVQVDGRNFGAYLEVALVFIDSTTGKKNLVTVLTDDIGAFSISVAIPDNATVGEQQIKARAHDSGQFPKRTFTVT